MKKLLIALLVLLVIGAVAVVTCPDKQAHKEAIMSVVNEKINDSVKPESEEDEGLSLVLGSLGSNVAGFFIDKMLKVDNHFIYSTGDLVYINGESKRVSVGAFGHIWTFNKEQLEKALEGNL